MPRIRQTFPNSKNVEVTIFGKNYFFHQRWSTSNGECNFDEASKNFSLRIHRFAAQTPKTAQKNQEFFERIIKFLKMFLCTCIMQLWPPCRKFLVKTLKKFCWISGNEEKLISLPKNWFVKTFVWTCTTNFWQACRNDACKSTKDLFGSKLENNSNAKFSKKNFSFILSFKKIKNLHLDTQNPVVTTLPKNFASKLSKLFARNP